MNNLQVLVRCYDKLATRSVSATNFGREAPASVTRRAARRTARVGGRLSGGQFSQPGWKPDLWAGAGGGLRLSRAWVVRATIDQVGWPSVGRHHTPVNR